MEFGTPERHAYCRDTTINSILYNLHNAQLENFTSGIPDSGARVIRISLIRLSHG